MQDQDQTDLLEILDMSDILKKNLEKCIKPNYLEGKSIALYFKKSSTRTRVSFEVGVYQLGGQALVLNDSTMQTSRGESIKDTARVLSQYVDAIMIRTHAHSEIEEYAKWASVPIINGLTEYAHPCQVLADLKTIRDSKGDFEKLKVAYIGDGNNMANSLLVGVLTAGAKMAIATPKNYAIPEILYQKFKDHPNAFFYTDPGQAVEGADVIITDVWASMGDEDTAEERMQTFQSTYQINDHLLQGAKEDAMVLHCLPAHREEEITEAIFEKNAPYIFEEVNNRLHVQKALILYLLGYGSKVK